MTRYLSGDAVAKQLGDVPPESLVGREVALPGKDGPVTYRLDRYLFQQDAFEVTESPAPAASERPGGRLTP